MRRQSPAEDILHQYFISSYFRTSLGFPQLKKKFRRQEKSKTFSSPTPLTYAASDAKAASRNLSLMNAKQTDGNNAQNVFLTNAFSPSISLDNIQENKEEPPNNVKGFHFIRRSETNDLALQTPNTNCRNNKAYHISEVMYYNRSMREDANDLRKKDSKSFGADSHSKGSQPPGPVPTIVVQRASLTESLHSLSSYNLSTPNKARNGENYGVIENKVMNADDAQNLPSEGSKVQHSTTDSSHANQEGESSTASNVIPNASAMDFPYLAYPILDNGRQTLDKPSSTDNSMHGQAAPDVDEAKYTFLSSLFNDSGSDDLALTMPSSNSNTTQPANTHIDNQLVNKSSNGPYDTQYYSHTGNSVTQRDLSEESSEINTLEDIAIKNAAFDNDDDNDSEAPTSAAPIIQYQLTTYSVTSVSRNDNVTDKNANNANVNAYETKGSDISRDNDNNNAYPGSSNTRLYEPIEQSDETPAKPRPPPMSLTDILIATGQMDVANQALAVRRANAFPEPESPKSPTRKFGFNKFRRTPKISGPVLVSSTSNIKTVPIVHLNPNENLKIFNKLQIDAAGISKSMKKFKVFAQDEPNRTMNISEPEVLMTPSLCKYFSEETLRRRFHIDPTQSIHGVEPASENSQGQFVKSFAAATATEHGKPRLHDKQLPDIPQAYSDAIPQSTNPVEPLYNINAIKRHTEGVKRFASVPKKETVWNLNSSENTNPIEDEQSITGRDYALRTPPPTPVSPSFAIANEATFGRASTEKSERDGAHRRKAESTVAAKIFSALNNFTDRNATAKYEPDFSDKADRHVKDKREHGANASKDGKRRRRSFVKNTIIVTQRPDDTQASSGTTQPDFSDGNANDNNRATIGAQGRKWLLAQCVTRNAPTESTNQGAINTAENASNDQGPNSLDDHQLRSSPDSFYAESLYDLYQYSEDSAGISSASLQDQDKNKGQDDETNDIWRVVNGLRLSSHVSQGNRNVYQKDAAGVESDAYYMAKKDGDAASFYRNDPSGSYRSTFTPPPLRPVVKPHSPASNKMSSDYFLPKLGTIYGSAAARI
ncbi:11369_t:CDS:1 [Paraglomus brasilianum]|uniref:11369_t:CDS:1 n=1 Tax=Paraglomus brasilianum TaxID=144538 RepID=A0A9N9D5X0_9GLOM|nr:11369_t:CDS:1 [Paraglomus brasilianum]